MSFNITVYEIANVNLVFVDLSLITNFEPDTQINIIESCQHFVQIL